MACVCTPVCAIFCALHGVRALGMGVREIILPEDGEHSISALKLGKWLDGKRDCERIQNSGHQVLSGHPSVVRMNLTETMGIVIQVLCQGGRQ